jgi:hypothetical protein
MNETFNSKKILLFHEYLQAWLESLSKLEQIIIPDSQERGIILESTIVGKVRSGYLKQLFGFC